MKKIIWIVFILVSVTGFAQHKKGPSKPKSKAYNSADYPSDQYKTRIDTAKLGQVNCVAVHVMSKALSEEPECKAWFMIKLGNKNAGMLFFDDIESDFGCAGVYFPKKQPRKDLLIAFKLGDYDGRTMIVDRDGKMNTTPGGEFYMSEDNKYLFADYRSDQPGVSIIDLDKNDLVYSDSATISHKLGPWYYQDDKFFSVAQPNEGEDTTQITIATLDLKKKKLIWSTQDKNYPEKKSMLKFYTFYDKPENKGSCNCGKL